MVTTAAISASNQLLAGIQHAASKTVYIETFGCQMNTADTEVVLARLSETGWSTVTSPEDAALVLYNTCSVRDNAEAKIRGRLGDMKNLKERRRKAGSNLTVGIMGCMAQREKNGLIEKFPQVDLVVGTDQFVHMPQLLDQVAQRGRLVATDFGDFEDQLWSAKRAEGVNAYVTIMRGCNYNCTYCVVPFTRGKEKSRPAQQIVDEVKQLVDQGHVQVTLLGQTVDAYGKTLGDGSNLARLLRQLHEIPGLKRLRFVTSHPKDITDELLDAVAELPRVAKHLHVPAQCGSDRILRLMGRRYTRDEYLRFVERARTRMPKVELLSDFIVGFPRETDADFQQTVDLLNEVRFGGSYVFMYSERPGTPSANLSDDVDPEVKRARCNQLLDLQMKHQAEDYAALHGSLQQVLVEGVSKNDDTMLSGRSIGNLNIVFPRTGNDGRIGDLVDIRIERSTSLTLFGTLVS